MLDRCDRINKRQKDNRWILNEFVKHQLMSRTIVTQIGIFYFFFFFVQQLLTNLNTGVTEMKTD